LLPEEREHLQLDGEVDLADVDARRRDQRNRREVQDAPHPGRGQPVTDGLGDVGRCRDDPDGGLRGGDDVGELVERPDGLPADALPDSRGRGVEEPDELEPTGTETGVVGQCGAQVADADQHAGAGPLHPEDARDPVAQRLDLVADPAHTAGTEVREVLAQAGRVDPGGLGQLTG
jgi:hypothetical protein